VEALAAAPGCEALKSHLCNNCDVLLDLLENAAVKPQLRQGALKALRSLGVTGVEEPAGLFPAAGAAGSMQAAGSYVPEAQAPAARQQFLHEGREIYAWEQSLEEVLVFITAPPGVLASHIACSISSSRLVLGLKGAPPFLSEELAALCLAAESFWNIEGSQITLTLTKARKGETWPSLCKGHGRLDALSEQDVHKRMLLERFQQEHPQFDFSQASMSGSAPDPRSFMGGVGYK
jgi:hypothetical protein